MTVVLGVDPGLSGGLALLERREADGTGVPFTVMHAVADIPAIGEGANRRVNVPAVLGWIRAKHRVPPDHAFMERGQGFPGQGISSTFRYGRACGALEACVAGLQIPLTLVAPVAWKRSLSLLGREKEASRQRALELFPTAVDDLSRHLDHGRAEAMLLAWYGLSELQKGSIAA